MHASVYETMKEGPWSPCLAGIISDTCPKCIFFRNPNKVKEASSITSKLRFVWLCSVDAYEEAVSQSRDRQPMQVVIAKGHLNIVASESMDGGRIRLLTESPCRGMVVVKLLAPVFIERFIYGCLRNACSVESKKVSESLLGILGVRSRKKPGSPEPWPGQYNQAVPALSEAQALSKAQRDIVTRIARDCEAVTTVWSPAGGGKTLAMGWLLSLWGKQARSKKDNRMAWIMVPRQLLREGIFQSLKDIFRVGSSFCVAPMGNGLTTWTSAPGLWQTRR